MATVIAVFGSPASGKTSLALKLAQEIYMTKQGIGKDGTVMVYSPDMMTPTIAYMFPNTRDRDLFSVGVALDKPNLYPEDVYRETVTVEYMRNMGYLGYKAGEDRYTYALPTEDKLDRFINVLSEIADCVVIDCTCRNDDLNSVIARRKATHIIQVVNPDLKSLAYYNSNPDLTEGTIIVMNIMDKELYLPISETEKFFGGVDAIVPYSYNLKKQSIIGELAAPIKDKKYRLALRPLLDIIYPPTDEELLIREKKNVPEFEPEAEPLVEGEEPVDEAEPLVEGEEPAGEAEPLVEGEDPVDEAEPLVEGEEPVDEVEPLVEGEEPVGEVEPLVEGEEPVGEVEPLVEGEENQSSPVGKYANLIYTDRESTLKERVDNGDEEIAYKRDGGVDEAEE